MSTIAQKKPATRPMARAGVLLRAREMGIGIALVLVVVLTTLFNHSFLSASSVQQLLTGASIFALLGVGETLVIITRNVDLSIGSVVGLSAYVVGNTFVNHPGMPVVLGFVIGIVVGAVVGAVNGLITTVTKVPSLVVTLAALYIVRGIDALIVDGKRIDPGSVPSSFQTIGYYNVFGVPLLFIIVAIVVAIAGFAMRSFRASRELYAIGSNPDAAALAGIPTGRRVFTAFLVSGSLAGLGGALFLAEYATVDSTGGTGYEFLVVAAVVVGGVAIFGGSGTILGAALGALLLNTINQALGSLKVSPFWNQAVAGALLLVAIAFDRWLSLRVARSLKSEQGHAEMSDVTAAPVLKMSPNGTAPPAERPSLRSVVRWESGLIVVLIAALWFGFAQPNFASSTTVFFMGYNMGEIAIMALPLMLIVMVGEIDLSVASMLGLSGTLMGLLFRDGWNIYLAMLAALVVGALGGALNGVLIAKLGLPSIAVTIGTLGLFRGLAEPLLGADSVSNFPASLTKIGAAGVFGSHFSFSTLVFVILAIIFGVVLHATPFGRSLFAIGLQSEAARFSGIRVDRIKFWLYVLSGVLCAFAGILFSLKNASARYDQGTGLELNVVAVVLFGGVSIFGGRGTVFGVVLSVLIFGTLQSAMTIINIDPQIQNIIIGVLLLISVIIPNGGEALRRIRARTRRSV